METIILATGNRNIQSILFPTRFVVAPRAGIIVDITTKALIPIAGALMTIILSIGNPHIPTILNVSVMVLCPMAAIRLIAFLMINFFPLPFGYNP